MHPERLVSGRRKCRDVAESMERVKIPLAHSGAITDRNNSK